MIRISRLKSTRSLHLSAVNKPLAGKKIVVGISGGVDSAMAAHILLQQGAEVSGVFMKNWDFIEEIGACSAERDWEDACQVCAHLNIPLVQYNFVSAYWTSVFTPFLEDCKRGLTPSPDLLCNKLIKFGVLCDKLDADQISYDYLATGHYAKIVSPLRLGSNASPLLKRPVDTFKDQTYFLSSITSSQLSKTLFPLGNLHKADIKAQAAKYMFPKVTAKKESMGICFIGKRNFRDFLSQYIPANPGQIITEKNCWLSTHQGLHLHTTGQKINLSGQRHRYYVYKKDLTAKTLIVIPESDISLLNQNLIRLSAPSWIAGDPFDSFDTADSALAYPFTFEIEFVAGHELIQEVRHFLHTSIQEEGPFLRLPCSVKIRRAGQAVPAHLYKSTQSQHYFIHLQKGCRAYAPTSGQPCVVYYNDFCLGNLSIAHTDLILPSKEGFL